MASTHLNCSRCGLSLDVRRMRFEPQHCPRCLARSRVLQPMFRSSLTIRQLAAQPARQAPSPRV